jgi:hypothetical protein
MRHVRIFIEALHLIHIYIVNLCAHYAVNSTKHHYRDYQQQQNHKDIIPNREQNQPIHQMHFRIHSGHRLQHAQQRRFGHHVTMLESATLSQKYIINI